MSTAPVLPLMTIEEYDKLPDPAGGFKYELHFGELVKVGQPKKGHNSLQHLIFDVLSRKLSPELWEVRIEMPYGLTQTYDARATDVGVVSREVWDAIPDDAFLIGSPSSGRGGEKPVEPRPRRWSKRQSCTSRMGRARY